MYIVFGGGFLGRLSAFFCHRVPGRILLCKFDFGFTQAAFFTLSTEGKAPIDAADSTDVSVWKCKCHFLTVSWI